MTFVLIRGDGGCLSALGYACHLARILVKALDGSWVNASHR